MKNVPFNFEDYDNDETRELFIEEQIAKLTGDDLMDIFDQAEDARLAPLLDAIASDSAYATGSRLLTIVREYIKHTIDDDELEDFAHDVHRDLCERE